MEQVGEGGRFRRGVFYFVVLLVFSHVVQAQMKYQTPRPDRPIRVFGGRFVFLTVQVNVILTCYAAVCLIESILGSRSKVLALVSSHFSSIAFPLGVFMGAGYYGFIHFHPKTRMLASAVEDFDFYMHLLHGIPLAFVICDNLFDCPGERRYQYDKSLRTTMDAVIVSIYGVFFVLWSFLCSRMNGGWWPYPKLILYTFFVATGPTLTAVGVKTRGKGADSVLSRRWVLDQSPRSRTENTNFCDTPLK